MRPRQAQPGSSRPSTHWSPSGDHSGDRAADTSIAAASHVVHQLITGRSQDVARPIIDDGSPQSPAMPQPAPTVFRFGPFEFDPKSGHLRSESSTNRLADQPLALLNALLERPLEVVSREELRLRLWPEGTFVDFDHGLNSAVSRLREALNDSANTPRFVETIPRRGYRLLVPVEAEGPVVGDAVAPTEPLPADDAVQPAAPAVAREPAMAWLVRRRALLAWIGVVAIALFVVFVAGIVQSRRDAGPVPLLASFVIDLPDEWIILNESPAISPDSRHIVFSAWNPRAGRRAIWHRPIDTGAARMLPATEDGSAPFWSPDGKSIGFSAEGKLKTIQLAGGPGARRLRRGAGRDRNMDQRGCHSVRAWTDRGSFRGQR